MDDLLTKLRAAAPQARDQRDRRRRARLKDRHQVRIASGQAMPDLSSSANTAADASESGLLSPTGTSVGGATESEDEPRPGSAGDSGTAAAAATIIGADGAAATDRAEGGDQIADRAASMLQGLRADEGEPPAGGGAGGGEESLRVRRRRESADEERARRRNRRNRNTAQSADVSAAPILEEEEKGGEVATPVTVVSPPSPEQMVTPPPE